MEIGYLSGGDFTKENCRQTEGPIILNTKESPSWKRVTRNCHSNQFAANQFVLKPYQVQIIPLDLLHFLKHHYIFN